MPTGRPLETGHVKQTRNFGLRNRVDMHARPRVEASAKGSKDILLRFSTELRLLTEVAHQNLIMRALSVLSLSPTSGISQRKRNRHRPMRPKPFIATRTIAARELCPGVTPFDVVCAWACSRDVLMSEVSQQRGIWNLKSGLLILVLERITTDGWLRMTVSINVLVV